MGNTLIKFPFDVLFFLFISSIVFRYPFSTLKTCTFSSHIILFRNFQEVRDNLDDKKDYIYFSSPFFPFFPSFFRSFSPLEPSLSSLIPRQPCYLAQTRQTRLLATEESYHGHYTRWKAVIFAFFLVSAASPPPARPLACLSSTTKTTMEAREREISGFHRLAETRNATQYHYRRRGFVSASGCGAPCGEVDGKGREREGENAPMPLDMGIE